MVLGHSKAQPKCRAGLWALYSTSTHLGFYAQLRCICMNCRQHITSRCVFWMAVTRTDTRGLWKMVSKNIRASVAYSRHFCGGLTKGRTGPGSSFDRQTGKWWIALTQSQRTHLVQGLGTQQIQVQGSLDHKKCHGCTMQSISLRYIFSDGPVYWQNLDNLTGKYFVLCITSASCTVLEHIGKQCIILYQGL